MDIGVKHTFVGQFFEVLGNNVLGGDLSRDDNGDVCLWKEETTVEIKASGEKSSYGFRLSLEQIESYERISEFPFARAWYLLFAYRNNARREKETGQRRTELSRYVTSVTINRYLAQSVLWGVALDLSIVCRWRDTLPVSIKSIMGHLGTKTIDLKCAKVHTFANGGLRNGLQDLKLDYRHYGKLSGVVNTSVQPDLLHEYRVQFPMMVILPSTEIRTTRRMLKRRGIHLKEEGI